MTQPFEQCEVNMINGEKSLSLALMVGYLQNLILDSTKSNNLITRFLQAEENEDTRLFEYFAERKSLEEPYETFLRTLEKATSQDKAKALHLLFNKLDDKESMALVADFESAVTSRMKMLSSLGKGASNLNEKILKTLLKPLVAPVLKSDLEILGVKAKCNETDKLSHPIIVELHDENYMVGKYTIAPEPNIGASEESVSSDSDTSFQEEDKVEPQVNKKEKLSPLPKHEKERMSSEKIQSKSMEIKRKILRILLHDKINTFELYDRVESLTELDYEKIKRNLDKLASLEELLKELAELSENELKFCGKLAPILNNLTSKKIAAASDEGFMNAINTLNSSIKNLKDPQVTCHRCFMQDIETRKLKCGHWFCDDCLQETYHNMLDNEKAPFATKCPLSTCFYVIPKEELVEMFDLEYYERIVQNNENCIPKVKKQCILCCLSTAKEFMEICEGNHIMCKNCVRGYIGRCTEERIFKFSKLADGNMTYDMPKCPIFNCKGKITTKAVNTFYTRTEKKWCFKNAVDEYGPKVYEILAPLIPEVAEEIKAQITENKPKCFSCGKTEGLVPKLVSCEENCGYRTCLEHQKEMHKVLSEKQSNFFVK